jgi:hypothetical protein
MGADAERLGTSCRAACEAAASGELMPMLEMLDPDVRWVGVAGEMRGAGVDAVASAPGDRSAEHLRRLRRHTAVFPDESHRR